MSLRIGRRTSCIIASVPPVGSGMTYSHPIRSPYYHSSLVFKKRCLCTGGGEGVRKKNGDIGLQKHSLPEGKVWNTVAKRLCLRTNYSRDDLVDMWHQFRSIAGNKMYLTRSDFNQLAKRNYGMRDVATVEMYFRAFKTDRCGWIEYEEVREKRELMNG